MELLDDLTPTFTAFYDMIRRFTHDPCDQFTSSELSTLTGIVCMTDFILDFLGFHGQTMKWFQNLLAGRNLSRHIGSDNHIFYSIQLTDIRSAFDTLQFQPFLIDQHIGDIVSASLATAGFYQAWLAS